MMFSLKNRPAEGHGHKPVERMKTFKDETTADPMLLLSGGVPSAGPSSCYRASVMCV